MAKDVAKRDLPPEALMDDSWGAPSIEENLAFVTTLQREVDEFYLRLFNHGVGTRFHAFLEWCGVMQEHLNITKGMLEEGVPAFEVNRHTGATPPIAGYQLSYLREKMDCIFDGLITVSTVQDEIAAKKSD